MDWVKEAETLFAVDKPEHFTDYRHCCECAEHDDTLRNTDVHHIGIDELGHPGWDPICFCSPEGKIYYTPAFVRLSLATIADELYIDQFLFHLEYDGPANDYYKACTPEQRKFIARFLEYLILDFSVELEDGFCADSAFRALEIWSGE